MYFIFAVSFFVISTLAQYPPPQSNLTVVKSPVDGNISIAYKTPPKGTCTTAFDTQQQYTGWINLPGTYPTNTFFWFIAAREPTSQLTVWFNGGPGSSSMIGLFTENGPCEVYEAGRGRFATRARDFGWDRGSNMLYIDQPTQVGFSYDTPTNGTIDLLTWNIYPSSQKPPSSRSSPIALQGTFGSSNRNHTANTTETAAMAIWHVLQAFLGSFPQYSPGNSTPATVGVNLFAESYGGKYGPAFASLWDKQNRKRSNGTIPQNGTVPIKLVSLGIVNGCIDDMIQAPFYPAMAVNNTYGLQAISSTRASLASASFYAAGGCQDLIGQCRSAVQALDPTDQGGVSSVNHICINAQRSCSTNVMEPYSDSGRSYYDISQLIPSSFPPSTYLEYLNSASFLSAIGSPVNYTESDLVVQSAFASTGDYERDSFLPDIARLLNEGIRVGLIYGDRDYICNWLGGEAVSIRVAEYASALYSARFSSAGYAPIITNSTYIGGVVRQYGNLSFSRIYDAGHEVPAYQPETAFQVFWRIISGLSISTGEVVDLSAYSSSGPTNSTHTNSLPASPSATCWLRNIPATCTKEQISMLENGKGVIINGVLYNSESDYALFSSAAPTPQGSVGSGGDRPANTPTTSSVVLTGAYTATATPSMKGAAGLSVSEIGTLRISLAIFGSLLSVISF